MKQFSSLQNKTNRKKLLFWLCSSITCHQRTVLIFWPWPLFLPKTIPLLFLFFFFLASNSWVLIGDLFWTMCHVGHACKWNFQIFVERELINCDCICFPLTQAFTSFTGVTLTALKGNLETCWLHSNWSSNEPSEHSHVSSGLDETNPHRWLTNSRLEKMKLCVAFGWIHF